MSNNVRKCKFFSHLCPEISQSCPDFCPDCESCPDEISSKSAMFFSLAILQMRMAAPAWKLKWCVSKCKSSVCQIFEFLHNHSNSYSHCPVFCVLRAQRCDACQVPGGYPGYLSILTFAQCTADILVVTWELWWCTSQYVWFPFVAPTDNWHWYYPLTPPQCLCSCGHHKPVSCMMHMTTFTITASGTKCCCSCFIWVHKFCGHIPPGCLSFHFFVTLYSRIDRPGAYQRCHWMFLNTHKIFVCNTFMIKIGSIHTMCHLICLWTLESGIIGIFMYTAFS